MHSTLAPKETGPNDKAAAKPDAVPTARADKTSADKTSARPARDVRPSATQDRTKSDVSAGKSTSVSNSTLAGNPGSAGKSTSAGNSGSAGKTTSAGNSTLAGNSGSAGKSAPVDKSAASVDAAFRAATVDNNKAPSGRPAMGKWARRALMGFLFALCSGGAVAGWMHYGDAVKAMVASWAPNGGPASSPQESSGVAEQPSLPVLQADAADQAAVPPAQSAPSVAPSAAPLPPEMAQLLQSMSQQIEQLKASMEELKTGQERISRYIARNSEARPAQATFEQTRIPEQNLGPRIPAGPLRTAATAPVRKPRPAYAPAQAAARPVVEPVLRPPLPLR
jgi:hypothetical protein